MISERADFDECPSAPTNTPNAVPAVPYIAPDLPGDDDEDGPTAAPEMLPPQGGSVEYGNCALSVSATLWRTVVMYSCYCVVP